MKKRVKTSACIFLIIFVSVVLFITNYKPGTNLIGWDNLYPELNFKENFLRNLFSIWQEYRGLGVEDGLAHAANLVQTLSIFLLSQFLPASSLRYVFQIGMHILGGLGMFFLLKRGGKKKDILALLGALFYQLNYITIQMFFAPLEVFSVHFAAIPWLFLALLLVLEQPSKKRIGIFFVTSLLFTPQGFVPTVFIAYCTGVFSLLLVRIVTHLSSFTQEFKKALMIIGIVIITNSFWLFPFIHAAVTQGPTIKNTKINQLSSEIVYENNKNRGGILDLLFLRGFMIDTTENNLKGQLDYIMKDWRAHLFQPTAYALQILFATLCITGLVITLKKKEAESSSHSFEDYFLPLILICTILLGTRIPLLSQINSFIRSTIPLFDEAFRFPFTKFSLVYVTGFTIFLVAGFEWIIKKLDVTRSVFFFILFSLCLFWYSLPAFQGHFFYNELRLTIPKDYSQVIKYMNGQDKSRRVMTLPQPSMWNWLYYNWGLRGSGFLWYGVAQPMLERPFDPWSSYNEQYSNEVFYALQKEDGQAFNRVIEKYDVSYILIDGYFQHTDKIQEFEKQQKFIESTVPSFEKHTFGKIIVYKLTQKDFVTIKKNLMPVNLVTQYTSFDTPYEDNEGYYQSESDWKIAYPFSSVFTNKTQTEIPFSASVTKDNITISSLQPLTLPHRDTNYFLNLQIEDPSQQLIPVKFEYENGTLRIVPYTVVVTVNHEKFGIPFTNEVSFNVGSDKVTGIKLNGVEAKLDTNNYSFAYLKAPNEITLQFDSRKERSISLSLLQSDLIQLPIQGENTDISITIPKAHFLGMNSSSIFENKTYEIKSPCGEVVTTGEAISSETSEGITLFSQGTDACIHQYMANIPQNIGVIAFINSSNTQGLDLRLIVDNPQQKTNIIDTKLNGPGDQKIIAIPPTSNYLYSDYGFHFRNTSPGRSVSKNTLKSLEISYFPYVFLQNIKIKSNEQFEKTIQETVSQEHPFVYLYVAQIPDSTNGVITLSQSYSNSWKAYSFEKKPGLLQKILPFLFGKQIKNHVLVNGWANGWSVEEAKNIVIVFLPQYLEYIGFILLILTFLVIIL